MDEMGHLNLMMPFQRKEVLNDKAPCGGLQLESAARQGINVTTFDTPAELHKIKRWES